MESSGAFFPERFRPFLFDLPEERIARFPAERREDARLLLIDRISGEREDHRIRDLPDILGSRDLLIRNATRVSWRRIALRRASGASTTALFLENPDPSRPSLWRVLMRRIHRIKEGELLFPISQEFSDQAFQFFRPDPQSTDSILVAVDRNPETGEPARESWADPEQAESFFERAGQVPLPPYLKRESEELDRIRYQTVYARHPGSVAAPTAGLHFTEELLGEIRNRGISLVDLELQIGYGTFAPLSEFNFIEKRLHPETYRIDEPTADLLNSPRRRIAVGTTSLRALEDNFRRHDGRFQSGEFTTSLFLYPPDSIHGAEGLLTNFHLPGSSLLLLVASFLGVEKTLENYRYAMDQKYRFFSYGDAMLIL